LPSDWMARALTFTPNIPSNAGANVSSTDPSKLRRITAFDPAMPNPATTTLPSSWTAAAVA